MLASASKNFFDSNVVRTMPYHYSELSLKSDNDIFKALADLDKDLDGYYDKKHNKWHCFAHSGSGSGSQRLLDYIIDGKVDTKGNYGTAVAALRDLGHKPSVQDALVALACHAQKTGRTDVLDRLFEMLHKANPELEKSVRDKLSKTGSKDSKDYDALVKQLPQNVDEAVKQLTVENNIPKTAEEETALAKALDKAIEDAKKEPQLLNVVYPPKPTKAEVLLQVKQKLSDKGLLDGVAGNTHTSSKQYDQILKQLPPNINADDAVAYLINDENIPKTAEEETALAKALDDAIVYARNHAPLYPLREGEPQRPTRADVLSQVKQKLSDKGLLDGVAGSTNDNSFVDLLQTFLQMSWDIPIGPVTVTLEDNVQSGA